MDYDRIKNLLNKYYDGDSSLKEEREIFKFFEQKDNSSEFIIEKQMFETFKRNSKESSPPKSLNDDILGLIEAKDRNTFISKYNHLTKWTIGIAASLLLFVGVNILFDTKSNEMVDTFSNEEQAYVATKHILCYVASVMNEEMSTLSGISHVNNGLESMKKLQKFDNTIQKFKTEKK
jgi:hypothetical protein